MHYRSTPAFGMRGYARRPNALAELRIARYLLRLARHLALYRARFPSCRSLDAVRLRRGCDVVARYRRRTYRYRRHRCRAFRVLAPWNTLGQPQRRPHLDLARSRRSRCVPDGVAKPAVLVKRRLKGYCQVGRSDRPPWQPVSLPRRSTDQRGLRDRLVARVCAAAERLDRTIMLTRCAKPGGCWASSRPRDRWGIVDGDGTRILTAQ